MQSASTREGLLCSHSWAKGQQTFYRAEGEMNFYKKRKAKCQILKKNTSRPLMAGNQPRLWITFLLKESCIMKHTEKICRETDSSVYFIHGTTFIQGTEEKKALNWEKRWWSSNNTIKPHRPRAEGQKTLVPSAWTWGRFLYRCCSFIASDGVHRIQQTLEGKSQDLFFWGGGKLKGRMKKLYKPCFIRKVLKVP